MRRQLCRRYPEGPRAKLNPSYCWRHVANTATLAKNWWEKQIPVVIIRAETAFTTPVAFIRAITVFGTYRQIIRRRMRTLDTRSPPSCRIDGLTRKCRRLGK
eukprot:g38484.t1